MAERRRWFDRHCTARDPSGSYHIRCDLSRGHADEHGWFYADLLYPWRNDGSDVKRCRALGSVERDRTEVRCDLARGHECLHRAKGSDDITYQWHVEQEAPEPRARAMRRCRDRCTWGNTRCELRRGHDGQHRAQLGQLTESSRWDPSSSAAPAPPSLFAALAGAVGFGQVVLGLVNLARGEVFIALVQFGIGTVGLSFWAPKLWRYRNGSREAVGDRERAGTDTAPSPGPAAGNASTAGAGPSVPLAQQAFQAQLNALKAAMVAQSQALAQAVQKTNAAVQGYAHAEAGEDERLPVREGDLPILAFKTATLVWQFGDDFGPALVSAYGDTPWGAQEAVCLYDGDHEQIPDEDCTCGFYARRNPEDVDATGNVLVDVELSGRVIVYERGYRAARQRILRVRLGPCIYCHAEASVIGCDAPTPDDIVLKNGAGQIVARHSEPSFEPTRTHAFCEEHADLSQTNLRMSVVELAERLAVPAGS